MNSSKIPLDIAQQTMLDYLKEGKTITIATKKFELFKSLICSQIQVVYPILTGTGILHTDYCFILDPDDIGEFLMHELKYIATKNTFYVSI